MGKYKKAQPGTTSEMFYDAMSGIGSTYLECQCGISHWAIDSRYLDELAADGIIVPDESDDPSSKVKHHYNCDSVMGYDLEGRLFVYGCSGCDAKLARYEEFIWAERDLIRSYLKIRVIEEKRRADMELTQNILAGIE